MNTKRPPSDPLPCPFCGTPDPDVWGGARACYIVSCTGCKAEVTGKVYGEDVPNEKLTTQHYARAEASAVARWNTRNGAAVLDAVDARVTAIEALRDRYMEEHDRLKAAGEYAAATERGDRADGLDMAVRILRGET